MLLCYLAKVCVCDVNNYRFLFLVACVTSHVCFLCRENLNPLCFGFVSVCVHSLVSQRVSLLCSANEASWPSISKSVSDWRSNSSEQVRCRFHICANKLGGTTMSPFADMNKLWGFISRYRYGYLNKFVYFINFFVLFDFKFILDILVNIFTHCDL